MHSAFILIKGQVPFETSAQCGAEDFGFARLGMSNHGPTSDVAFPLVSFTLGLAQSKRTLTPFPVANVTHILMFSRHASGSG